MLCYSEYTMCYSALLSEILPNNITNIGTCPPLFKIILF